MPAAASQPTRAGGRLPPALPRAGRSSRRPGAGSPAGDPAPGQGRRMMILETAGVSRRDGRGPAPLLRGPHARRHEVSSAAPTCMKEAGGACAYGGPFFRSTPNRPGNSCAWSLVCRRAAGRSSMLTAAWAPWPGPGRGRVRLHRRGNPSAVADARENAGVCRHHRARGRWRCA